MADIIRAGVKIDSAEGVQNLNRATKAFDDADKASKRMNASIQQSNKAFNSLKNLAGAVIGIGTITKAYRDFTAATIEGEQADAKLNATLRATGGAAGLTARQIDDLATSMAQTTLFDDDAVKNSAAILTTFRNVSGDTFKQAIRLSADLSAVMGTDLQGSVLQVGKALNDPILGMTALRRVGVSFSEAQRALIENFVKTNDLASAQKIILDELALEFGGAAGAANTGLSGAIHAAKKSYDEFLESLGRTEQAGGAIQDVFRAIANFWKSRELTTDPLEDMRIGLDKAETELFQFQEAMGQLERGERGLSGVVTEFIDFEGRAAMTTEEATAALIHHGVALAASVNSRRAAIKTVEESRTAEERDAAAKAAAAKAEQERERQREQRRLKAEKEREEQERRTKAINDEIAALQLQAAVLGMTEREAALYTLRMGGATEANLEAADAALKAIETFERQREEMAEAKKKMEEEQERLRKQAEEEARAYEIIWEQALRNTQDVFADFFEQLFTTATFRTDQILKQLWRMWMRFLAQLAAHALFRFVFKIATGGLGFPGPGGGTFGVDTPGLPADVGHSGGTVGSMASVRVVDPRTFIAAPRYHAGGVAGLKPNEVPVIAEKGERIIPKGDSSGRTVVFQFPEGGVFDYGNPEQRRQFTRMMRTVLELHEIDVEVT